MKTITKRKKWMAIVAVALSVLINAPVMAQGGMEVYLLPCKGKRAVLKVSPYRPLAQSVSVKITDRYGKVLYTESLSKSDEFEKMFDFSFVGSGTYTVDVMSDGDLMRSHVTVTDDKLTTENLGQGLINPLAFKKNISEKGEKLKVLFENRLNEPMTLKIFDTEQGELIHEEKNILDLNFAKLYDLSQLEKGIYAMSITGQSYSYYHNVDLR